MRVELYTLWGYNELRMEASKEKLVRRLKIVEGQVRGLQDMIEKGAYCIDVITQTSAVKQALSGIEDVLMENHLNTCATEQIKKGNSRKAAEEILKVYRLKRK
jgi:CsoR family transcriptional regulator, copper-sensing transcriptional repressor